MSVIAHQANVSTATLYKHFESKERLFEDVVRNAYAAVEEGAAHVVDGDAANTLFTFLGESVRRHSSQDANNLLRVAWAEVPESAELARAFFESQLQARHAELRALLDHLVKRGDLVGHDTDLGAGQISGMVKEALVWPGIYKATHDLPANADEIIRQAIETYLARFSGKRVASTGAAGASKRLQSTGKLPGLETRAHA
jgi:AcrR family transcriptional regulator